MHGLKVERINGTITKLSFGKPSNPVNILSEFEEEGNFFALKEMAESGETAIFANEKRVATLKEIHSEEGKTCVKLHSKSSHFLGLGEKIGPVDKKGKKFEMFAMDNPIHLPNTDPLYISIPFFVVVSPDKPAAGIYVNSTSKTSFDFQTDDYVICTHDNGIELYLIYGPTVIDVIKRFVTLTGKPALPPAWALGYQQSRWSYGSEKEVMEIAKKMRDDNIPCDVIYLEIDYMDGYRIFTWSKSFPNPKKMISELKKMGFKIVTIIDPGVKKDDGYEVYLSGKKIDAFAKKPNGEDFEGYVWPGKCVFPDFLKNGVREWWSEKHKALFEVGVDGIWNDMNEPAVVWDDDKGKRLHEIAEGQFSFQKLGELKSLPKQDGYEEKIIHEDDSKNQWKHLKVRNVYALLEAMATQKAFEKFKKNKRPFILNRAGFAGIQKYAAVWTGDNSSWWEHLESSISEILSLNVSGVSFCGADVGGFGDDCTSELLVRWTEMGVFMPFFRNHSAIGTRHQEPWSFDKHTEEILKKHIRRRYELFPHLYNLFYESAKSGVPIVRPILTCDQEDEDLYCVNDEFMFGENVLVAPITRPNTFWRSVYLPKGRWFSLDGRTVFDGKKLHKVESPLEEIPIFVRENSVIFKTEPMNFLFEKRDLTLYIDVYGENAKQTLYEDDGETLEYKKGIYNLYTFSIARTQNSYHANFQCTHHAYDGIYKRIIFRMRTHAGNVDGITVNGKKVKHRFENGVLCFELNADEFS